MKVLVVSYNPVPTSDTSSVEGSGLRCWRIAQSLRELGLNVRVAVLYSEKMLNSTVYEGIEIIPFQATNRGIEELGLSKYDSVVANFWMSGIAQKILDHIPKETQFIADLLSPFYVEFVSRGAGHSADSHIQKWYPTQLEECNRVLAGCDYALIASENQKHLYTGVLGGLGGLESWSADRFILFPGVVEPNIAPKRTKSTKKLEVLWFGGLYPWFDFSVLIDIFSDPAVQEVAYLRVVGGSNPMYAKTDIRYNGQYVAANKQAKKSGLLNKHIFFDDWVPYQERLKIFANADVAISLNSKGMENEYSWRLRVSDLAGNGVPVITNGGDPLGEKLISAGAAFRIDISTRKKAVSSLLAILKNSEKVNKSKIALTTVSDELHTAYYAKELAKVISKNDKPRLRTKLPLLLRPNRVQDQLSKVESQLVELQESHDELQKEFDMLYKKYTDLPKTLTEFSSRTAKRLIGIKKTR